MKKITLCFLISIMIANALTAQDNTVIVKHAQGDHLQGTVNVKILPQFRDYFQALNNTLPGFDELGITSIHKKFPNRKPPVNEYHLNGKKLPDLSLIYELKFTTTKNAFDVSSELMKSDYFQYAEPHFVSYPLFTPDDDQTEFYNPYHFNTLQLYNAWNITQGDTNIVIGFTDTSFDLNHEDLRDNIKYNYADTIGNGDDDGDTFPDNYAGWDLVDNDNNLFIANEYHGTSVVAVASATTDNTTGVSGAGFKCMFLPVKVANSSQVITKGYEGIVYCVDHGAKIVNCSWGNTNGFNQLAQDVIDDAVLVNDVLIVASAGNTDSENYYYPASYEYVLSVTGVDANDLINPAGSPTPFTRNDSVDVSAPGFNIFSTATVGASTYVYSQTTGGTSIAAPLVAGVAGLVWTQFPNLSALEVIERIKCTADNIDAVPGNEIYAGLIGTGRVNAFSAVSTNNQCGLVGISDSKEEQGILLYPNPAQDILNVVFQSTVYSPQSTIEINNSIGETVYFSHLTSHISHLGISSLSAGIYYCVVENGKASFRKKIVVVR